MTLVINHSPSSSGLMPVRFNLAWLTCSPPACSGPPIWSPAMGPLWAEPEYLLEQRAEWFDQLRPIVVASKGGNLVRSHAPVPNGSQALLFIVLKIA